MPELKFVKTEGRVLAYQDPDHPEYEYHFRRVSGGSNRSEFRLLRFIDGAPPRGLEVSYSRYLGSIEHPHGNTVLEIDFAHWLGKQRKRGRWLIEIEYLGDDGLLETHKRPALGSAVSIAQYFHKCGVRISDKSYDVDGIDFLEGPHYHGGMSKPVHSRNPYR